MKGELFGIMLLGFALSEATFLFALLMAFLLLFNFFLIFFVTAAIYVLGYYFLLCKGFDSSIIKIFKLKYLKIKRSKNLSNITILFYFLFILIYNFFSFKNVLFYSTISSVLIMHLLIFIFIEKTKRYSYIIFNFDNIFKNLYILKRKYLIEPMIYDVWDGETKTLYINFYFFIIEWTNFLTLIFFISANIIKYFFIYFYLYYFIYKIIQSKNKLNFFYDNSINILLCILLSIYDFPIFIFFWIYGYISFCIKHGKIVSIFAFFANNSCSIMSYKNKKRNIRFFYSNGPSNFPLTNILHNCSNIGSNIFHKGIKFKNIPVYSLVFSSKNIDYRPPCLIHIDKNMFARYDGNIKKISIHFF